MTGATAACSRLVLSLGALGLAGSTTAALCTYRLQQEPLTLAAAGLAVQIAERGCSTLQRARSWLLPAADGQFSASADAAITAGVFSPTDGSLTVRQPGPFSPGRSRALLRDLPGTTALARTATPRRSATQPRTATAADPPPCQAAIVHTTVHADAVRVQALTAAGPGRLALVRGGEPPAARGGIAFALVDLHSAAQPLNAAERRMRALLDPGGDAIQLTVTVQGDGAASLQPPPADLLSARREMAFADQRLSLQVAISPAAISQRAGRAAAVAFLLGLVGTGLVLLLSRRAERRFQRLTDCLRLESRTDGLTRIANRRAWDETLDLEEGRRQRYGHQYGLVVIDLNGFKGINDRQGHKAGDEVLQITASRLSAQLRDSDLLARVGGDEFALLVGDPGPEGLEELVGRLRQALAEAGIAASIGAALSRRDATLEQTWAEADDAMYRVKSSRPAPTTAL